MAKKLISVYDQDPKFSAGDLAYLGLKKKRSGATLATLNSVVCNVIPLVRVVPNIAVSTLKGTAAICADKSVNEPKYASVFDEFSQLGERFVLCECQIDAFAALAESCPAFVLRHNRFWRRQAPA